MLLAIDTSTQLAGLALYDGAIRAELAWVAGRQHSVQLLPQLERLLELVGVSTEDLTVIAACRGPGSFTGVRVGLAVAQGLAIALDVPAYGVSSLDVLAACQEGSPLPVRPLLEAGRGRFATALYERRDGSFVAQGEPCSIELGQLQKLVDGPCLLCGDLNDTARAELRAMLGERVVIASPAASLRRPGVLAQLGWQLFQSGAPGEPRELQPIYVSR